MRTRHVVLKKKVTSTFISSLLFLYVQNIYYFLQHGELHITPSIPNYNSFDFFCHLLAYSIFFEKNKIFKAAFKIYYIQNNITSKINNNYEFFE
jgi:hypothetical protein